MPIDTQQVANVVLTDTFTQFKDKTNELIEIVNGLPATKAGAITRLGGTIDGLSTGIPDSGDDGTLYIGSGDKKVYAIKTDSKGPAKSAWPMFGQNARHTGRAPKK